eukprot:CAMPEP_0175038890 /NCGR_PEP_ID=MMETSP0052_2-20121109/170_1 /TAXON_ID=51329 ORGANISM="Polytomella parva, Strain SAG 63-3" /NCGR_SAMPLE_ID=MMETSP0052_2 /ASSEMBLY_ACC=CAM_ASM_000194 /LENGTH=34 /DNA_ID= /DNA_START= /DNA_END= /DNA_ORIENTATION=
MNSRKSDYENMHAFRKSICYKTDIPPNESKRKYD